MGVAKICIDFFLGGGWVEGERVNRLAHNGLALKTKKVKNVLLHANISDTPFDQMSPGPPEAGVLNFHLHIDTKTDKRTRRLYD